MKFILFSLFILLFFLLSCAPSPTTSLVLADTPTLAPATSTETPSIAPLDATNTAVWATVHAVSTLQIATVLAIPGQQTFLPALTREPTSTPLPSPTPGVSYKYDVGVTPDQRKLINDAIGIGRKYFGDVWTLELYAYADTNALCVEYRLRTSSLSCVPVLADNLAFATRYLIFLKTSGIGWQRVPSPLRIFSIVHEYFHIVQSYLVGGRSPTYLPRDTGPLWFVEGSAEFAGVHVLYNEGLYDVGLIRQQKIVDARHIHAPLKDLETIKGARAAGDSSEYSLGFLAVEYLALNYGGTQNINKYYEAIGISKSWQDAFKTTYGFSSDEFYDKFEDFRRVNFPPIQ